MTTPASERLREQLQTIADGEMTMDGRRVWSNCPHGVSPIYVCGKCEQRSWAATRELVLYDTLDRFSAAVEKLAAVLGGAEPQASTASEGGDSRV